MAPRAPSLPRRIAALLDKRPVKIALAICIVVSLLPLPRLAIVNDGESFSAGDRTLTAVIPPTFDSPTTRGLYDSSTGVYWAVDSMGTPVTAEVTDVGDLDADFWRGGVVEMSFPEVDWSLLPVRREVADELRWQMRPRGGWV